MTASDFARLAKSLGVADHYRHAAGHSVEIDTGIRRRLTAALGFPAGTPDEVIDGLRRLNQRTWQHALPAVQVHRQSGGPIEVPIRGQVETNSKHATLTLRLQGGEEQVWRAELDRLPVVATATVEGRRFACRRLPIPGALPPGYHRLSVESDPRPMSLIVAPQTGYLPPHLAVGGRAWGLSLQLFGLRSGSNWGHGSFSDLAAAAKATGAAGGGFVGVNPLHALFPVRPNRRCPYAPSSRRFLNPLYLDPTALPEFARCAMAGRRVDRPGFQERLVRLRAAGMIDYPAAAALIWPILEALHLEFRKNRSAADDADFRRFVDHAGEALLDYARFEALTEHFAGGQPEEAGIGWQHWPAAFRQPRSPAVAALAAERAQRVELHQFLQWRLDGQLAAAAAAGAAMPVGLYRDLAVGFDHDGSEAWTEQATVMSGVSVGCPPDLRNPLGQDWGVAGYSPLALEESGYAPFIAVLRANMRHAGALRIDHAFQIARLYLVPHGEPPTRGSYLRYPMDDLLGIVALESRQNRCMVIAEDLGTIPDGFREAAMASQALSYRIIHRERAPDDGYLPAAGYPERAAVSLGTHDQATLAGFWLARDIATRLRLELYPTAAAAEAAPVARDRDRRLLLEALGLAAHPPEVLTDPDGRPSEVLVTAAHRFLAETPCRMVIVNPDDLAGALDQVNLPHTIDQYPNWRRRCPATIPALLEHPAIRMLTEIFETRRCQEEPPSRATRPAQPIA
ncbi:MAG: 4-alpha-glucanotransferase [Azospirillum sp.]|nr:4-alpha-glucanotransferase [Azospirillum sp.]